MPGLKITVDANFTNGISVKDDERLNSGSILLLEPARDGLVGIPTSLKNYAESSFYANAGASVASIALVNTISSEPGALVERTAKGGIHTIVPTTLTSSSTNRRRFAATLPQEVLDYCVANKTHKFYFSMFGVVTRNVANISGVDSVTLAGINAPPSGSSTTDPTDTINIYQNDTTKSVSGGSPSASLISQTGAAVEELAWFVDVAKNGFTFPSTLNLDQARKEIFTMGARGAGSFVNDMPSWILYSLYFEDMTVSGRTYEQCRADGQTMFNRRFGAGGKYENDTWTVPA